MSCHKTSRNWRLFAVLELATVGSVTLPAQPLHFAAEKISISVDGGQCRLSGEYHFRNPGPTPVETGLFYPFAIRNDQPFPDSILVEDVLARGPITYSRLDSGVVFLVRVPPLSTRIYRVSFQQKTHKSRFEYILTTTRKWPKPVGWAEFVISLARDLMLYRINTPAKESVQNNGARMYRIQRTDFLSDQNLVIQWKKRSP